MLRNQIQALLIYIDRYHRCAHGGCDLNAESADSSHAYNDRDVVGLQRGAAKRLIRSGHGIGNNR